MIGWSSVTAEIHNNQSELQLRQKSVNLSGSTFSMDAGVSEASRKKAEAAKSYIENMYRNKTQKVQERRDR